MQLVDAQQAIFDIARDVRKGECVLFVGREIPNRQAGISNNLELAQKLYERYCRVERPQCNLSCKRSLSAIAQCCINSLGRERLADHIRSIIEADQRAMGRSAMIYLLLAELNPLKAVITSGWDSLVEAVYALKGVSPRLICGDRDISTWSGEQVNIVKLLGDPVRGNCVVTEEDYDLFERRSPGLLRVLSTLLSLHTLVVLGYSSEEDSCFRRLHGSVQFDILSTVIDSRLENRITRPTYVVGRYETSFVEFLQRRGISVVSMSDEGFLRRLIDAVRVEEAEPPKSIPRPPIEEGLARRLNRIRESLESTNLFTTAKDRESVMWRARLDELVPIIDFDGKTRTFLTLLLRTLASQELSDERDPLEALLVCALEEVGQLEKLEDLLK